MFADQGRHVPEVGGQPDQQPVGATHEADRINRIVGHRKGLDRDPANPEFLPALKEAPVDPADQAVG